jgi:hypothetical protein
MSGVDLCSMHESLSNCWRQSFIESIVVVSERQENQAARDFLHFMLGVMATSWTDYLADLHGEKRRMKVN